MPASKSDAVHFLETQWSKINDNKLKGIVSEVSFRRYLDSRSVNYIPGGWVLHPGKRTSAVSPTTQRICLLPIEHRFSWQPSHSSGGGSSFSLAAMSAYSFFLQVGIKPYFVEPSNLNETDFELPSPSVRSKRARYPRPYRLRFTSPGNGNSRVEERYEDVMRNFPRRDGNKGMRCNATGRIDQSASPWADSDSVAGLFWFEYARYYCQVDYLVSNNDLDMFIVAPSGKVYPVELKSKSVRPDADHGDWFGFDIGPYTKLAFFTANSMNTDALYVVEEVDSDRNHIDWLGIRFTDLVKVCYWVSQAGGQAMNGGASNTIKVPRDEFQPLDSLLPLL